MSYFIIFAIFIAAVIFFAGTIMIREGNIFLGDVMIIVALFVFSMVGSSTSKKESAFPSKISSPASPASQASQPQPVQK